MKKLFLTVIVPAHPKEYKIGKRSFYQVSHNEKGDSVLVLLVKKSA